MKSKVQPSAVFVGEVKADTTEEEVGNKRSTVTRRLVASVDAQVITKNTPPTLGEGERQAVKPSNPIFPFHAV